jgi:hypothetical protein
MRLTGLQRHQRLCICLLFATTAAATGPGEQIRLQVTTATVDDSLHEFSSLLVVTLTSDLASLPRILHVCSKGQEDPSRVAGMASAGHPPSRLM